MTHYLYPPGTHFQVSMDITRFDERYRNDEIGCKAYNPKVLLKIVLLAYARGINTSRKIERACIRECSVYGNELRSGT